MTTHSVPLDRALLERLHPEGAVRAALVIGDGAPAGLRSDAQETRPRARPDLVVVAPDREQAARAGWARETAAAAASVAADGLVYVVAGPRARRRLMVELRQQGLVVTGSFLTVPNALEPRFLVPLERGPLRYAAAELMPLRRRNRRLATAVAGVPALPLLTAAATPVATVLQPAGARPLFAWARPASVAGPFRAIVARGERAHRFTLIVFDGRGSAPRAIVKVGLEQEQAHVLADRLTRFGPGATAAGARVPELLGVDVAGRAAVVETVVPGRSAYSFLLDRPGRVAAVLEPLAGWLASWNASTATAGVVTSDLLDRRIWAPMRAIEPDLGEPGLLRDVLERACRAAEGRPCRLVATHGDLTMSNVLVSRGAVGVVDWEHAEADGLPLTDLFYAAADAVAAVDGYADRPAAARACFEPGGRQAALVARLRVELVRRLDLSPAVEELCFLACWLHHASNEALERDGRQRPFRALLEWAAEKGAG